MFDIKNPNTFLGGQNVHNLLILGALAFIIYNQLEMQKKAKSLDEEMAQFSNFFRRRRKRARSVYGGRKPLADATVIDNP